MTTPPWIRIRLGLLLAAIFLLGALAGHLASRRLSSHLHLPPGAASPPSPPSAPPSTGSNTAAEDGEAPSKKTSIQATRTVMAQYRSALSLTDEQMILLKPLFKETGIEMSHLPRGSSLRLAALESFHQKIRPHLTPKQQTLCEEILNRARARIAEKQ